MTLRDFIGSGTTGDVYKAEYASTDVACKLLRKRQVSDREMQFLVDECQLMLKLRHPNVLLMIGITSDRLMNHGILTELMDFSLAELIERTVEPAPTWEYPFVSIAFDVARGMAYLHEHSVLHRDLKPGNVLLKQPGMVAKVADFGASRDLAPGAGANTSMTMTMAGTPVFMAPEVLRQDRYGKEADVWSFGGLLVHIATRCPPYTKLLESTPPYALMQSVAHGEIRPTSDIDDLCPDWPEDVKQIAEACCRADRADRPTFETIVEDLKGTIKTYSLHFETHTLGSVGSFCSSRPSGPSARGGSCATSFAGDSPSRSPRMSQVSAASGASPTHVGRSGAERYGSEAERAMCSSFEASYRRSRSKRQTHGSRGGMPVDDIGGVRFTFCTQNSVEGMRPGERLEQARQRASERGRTRPSPVRTLPVAGGPPRMAPIRSRSRLANSIRGSQRSSGRESAGEGSPSPRVSLGRPRPPPPPSTAPDSASPSERLTGGLRRGAQEAEVSQRSSAGWRRGSSASRRDSTRSESSPASGLMPLPQFPQSSSTLQSRTKIDLDKIDLEAGETNAVTDDASTVGRFVCATPPDTMQERLRLWGRSWAGIWGEETSRAA